MAECTLLFVGTATTVLRLGPFTLLTDPNFLRRGQRAYLGKGLVSKRLTDPAVDPRDLPPLDAVVLSHLHGDHWDRVAHRHLDREVPILTTPQAAAALRGRRWQRRAVGLRPWQRRETTRAGYRLTLTALPGRHAPRLARPLVPPVMGSLLELTRDDGSEPPQRIYLSGDTLNVPELQQIADRCPPLDSAIVHLGGTTLPGGLLVTMDDRQGADLMELLQPRQAVPVHYDDYSVFRSPLQAFLDTASRRGLRDRVTPVARGETVTIGGVAAFAG